MRGAAVRWQVRSNVPGGKTTLVAHSTSDLETRAFFPRPGSQISMSGVNQLVVRGPPRARLLVLSCSERTLSPNSREASRIEMSHWRQSKKGEAKRTYKVVCQLWRRDAVATPTLHSITSPPRRAVLVCGECFLIQSEGHVA